MAATREEVAAIELAVSEARAQYARARVRVEANTGGWLASGEASSIRKAFKDVGALLERWATVYRAWAVNGQRDDGTTYAVARFLDFGRTELADAVLQISAEAYDRSAFAAVKYAASETGRQLNPLNWPLGVKVAVGVGVVVLVVVVARR